MNNKSFEEFLHKLIKGNDFSEGNKMEIPKLDITKYEQSCDELDENALGAVAGGLYREGGSDFDENS